MTYENLRATLTKFEEAGVPCPAANLSLHSVTREDAIAVVRALPDYTWQVQSSGSTWLSGRRQGGPQVSVFIREDFNHAPEPPAVAHARALLAEAQS